MNFPDLYEAWAHAEDFLCRIRGSTVSYRQGLQQYDEVRCTFSLGIDVAHGRTVDPQSVGWEQRSRQEVTFSESYQGHDIGWRSDTNRVVRSQGEPRSRNGYHLCLLGAYSLRALKEPGIPTETVRGHFQFGISDRHEFFGEYTKAESLREGGHSMGRRRSSYASSGCPTGRR